uniref:EpoD n=2 Tax=Sorangium cellulosum TaxID=56 RepID=D2X8Z6_SORCE|nr:EpoD [Sorangium cellulosum]
MTTRGPTAQQNPLKQAAIIIQRLEERLAGLAQAELERTEPIAIVGIGCRFPGGADAPEAFWELLDAERDAVQPLDRRWGLVGVAPVEAVPHWAGLLIEPIDCFDAAFFGISPREARSLDPQHRLLLEVAWEGLEDAGIPPRSIDGSRTGVFVGAFTADYARTVARLPREERDAYSATGNMLSIAAGRLSYTLGLQGPCLTVDTACSSSLVAIHLACRSLRAGESDLALAGGVSALLSPDMMEAAARTQALSPDGRCRTFDASANGFVRGEGCGLVVLKRLSDAQRDGDRIWALIRGSAINHDGRSTGLTAPNVLAQETVLREALRSAQVEAGAVDYVETHGTGTSLGDPIEVEALRATVGPARSDGTRCVLGAVKTNIGHLEAAAGVAGLIKAALSLTHERIPRNLNFRTLNPRLRLEGSALALATEPVPWPRTDRPRFAGVSSFGMSGTNAHVVLEEAPAVELGPAAPERSAELLVLSGKSEGALDAQAARLREHLDMHPELGLGDVAFSLATTRSAMTHRLAVAVTSREGLLAALSAVAQGQTPAGAARCIASSSRGKLALLFTGQGAQTPGMGRGLCAAWPAFREAFDRCVALFDRELDRPLCEVMWAEPGSAESLLLDQTAFTQPALFTVEYALTALWRSWGVEPELLVGHSIGELVAACVAGVFSLEDGVRLVAARGRLMQGLSAGGAMVSLGAPEAEVAAAVAPHAAWVSIAAVNGPEQVVIAGVEQAVQAIAAGFAARGVRTKRLHVSHAFHSPLMEPMLEEFGRVAASVTYRRPSVSLVSNLSGKVVTDELSAPGYWVRHVREAVRFADGVKALHEAGAGTFLEVGPKPTLLGLLPACLPEAEPTLLASLRAGREEAAGVLEALGRLWAAGGSVSWPGVFPTAGRRVPLPTYPWQRQRYWIEAPAEGLGATAADALAQWFYRVDWPEMPRSSVDSRRARSGGWLVLADRGGVGEAAAAALSSQGCSCAVLHAPAEASAVAEQVTQALGGRNDWQGVLYLWGLDAVVEAGASAEEVAEVTHLAAAPVLALIQALGTGPRSPRLWIVTRGACTVGDEPAIAPCQAALWGMGRVAALEHPGSWGGLVDLDPEESPTEVEALVAELLSPDAEDQLAFRQGRRRAARLVAAPPEGNAAPVSLSAEGSYLVTGGLGALGLLVARWLVERGAGHLVLISRHGLPDREEWGRDQPPEVRARIAAIEALEAQGARVTVAAVDVADAEGMAALLAAVEPPLRGVVHAAGLLDDGLLAHQDAGRLARVLRPKVEGAWVLHTLTREQPLDLFVLFSSASGVFGSIGQGSYAAGNAFLDALADLRRTQGLAALSIAWGLWAEGGMGSQAQRREHEASGIWAMPTSRALAAMEWLLGTRATQRVVIQMDWAHAGAAPRDASRGRFWDRLVTATKAASSSAVPAVERWRNASVVETRSALYELVRGVVAGVMGFTDQGTLDVRRGFAEQGLDSLMAVEIRKRLQGELGMPLSATLAFDHPTVERLVEYLLSQALELQDRTDVRSARLPATEDPIAIVGAACRFPGGVEDLESYWQLLTEGVVVSTEVPADRWNGADGRVPGSGEAQRQTYVPRGGFLREVETFDAAFFHISPREAMSLDPQQRLLLEVSWEAIERAGQDPSALRESPTGVFVGAGPNEYAERVQDLADEAAGLYSGTGNMLSVAAGRLSFFLGLHGPTLAVDTACSSSLVALHLGCQSLRRGECDQALVGGVNMLLSPRTFALLSRMHALSPGGRCKTFSADADGYARAEGCAVVVLKRLSDAQRDRDPILAVIRGTAINHDGPSSGLTVPSGPAQEALLRQALAHAGVVPADVDFVECHGTGTALGDPIEVRALSDVYGQARPADRPLILGAAKANLGHMEPAAGLAGLLKAVLALGQEQIPAQPELGELNPLLPWEALPVAVARAAVPWPRTDRPRFAGVSSFGMSGTNAHVVLEEAPAVELGPAAPERSAELLVLSGKSEGALDAQAARLREHLDMHPELGLGDVAFSLATTRSAMTHRLAVAVTSREGLLAALSAVAQGQTPAGAARCIASSSRGKLALLFTGQGAQTPGMGRGLCAAWPAFREAFDRCVALFDRELDRPLCEVMWAEPGSAESLLLDQTAFTQPALFTVEYALTALWRSWGVEPELVAGHSAGELVAACVAGVFSLEDGVRLVAARGRLMQGLSAGGAMVSLGAPEAEVAAAVAPHAAWVSIAAVNGPEQVVIAGVEQAVQAIAAGFAARGVRTKRLHVSHAFHSPLMEPMLEEFGRVAASVTYRRPSVSLVSNLSGKVVADELSAPGYWVRHVREAVRFADGVKALHEAGAGTFLEVGPKPTLLGLLPACLPETEPTLLASLRAGREEAAGVLEALGRLWAAGGSVSWPGVFPTAGRRVPLPTYPWQRQRYWPDIELDSRRHAAADPTQGWFYRVDWPEIPRSLQKSEEASRGSWLVLADKGGVGEAVAAALSTRGLPCVVLHAPAETSATAELVTEAAGGRSDWQVVLYLWGLDAVVGAEASIDEIGDATRRATAPVLGLARFLSTVSCSPRLWVVTRGACIVGDEPAIAPCQAALWGMGRVAALEHPGAWGGLVDLDSRASPPQASPIDGEMLVTELLSQETEDQLAFRHGRRHAARLVAAPPQGQAAPVSLSAEASYLVTGGLGGLGLIVAQWLVELGARHLVLTSRRGLPDRQAWREQQPPEIRARIAAVEALEARGARVTVAAVDVADVEPMTALVSSVEPPLRGVVHAAGVSVMRPLAETDETLLESVLRPKVAGSWLLHRLLHGRPLDLFVLFSSGAAVWGSHSQGAYAAANAFLDGLAHLRRSQSLPALSVAWGLWAEGGMADAEAHARLSDIGVLPMSTSAALSALQRLVETGAAQRTVTRMDWARFAPVYTARGRRNLLSALVAGRDIIAPSPPAAATRNWRGLSVAEARMALHEIVHGAVARVLGFLDPSALDPGMGFNEQGLDSLMAVEIRNLLQAELDVRLSTTLAFDHPTVQRLVEHLLVDVLKLEDRSDTQHVRSLASDEPIAIVGAACRFPGGVEDLESYWQLLAEGVVVSAEVPADRWDAADWYDPDPEIPGRTYVTKGAFLRDLQRLDATFFRISPREAMSLDPQQRLLLEVSWEALESAGIAPDTLRDSPTGVFVGAGPNEYYTQRLRGFTDGAAGLYGGTGNMLSVAAGRLSFFLGLHGPTLAMDTACSSSLVALHLACQSLRLGECDQALVGGVNVLLAPETFVLLSRMRALSPDGRCKTFSADADGYARGEGCAVVVLKRLRDAQRAGDSILALIRGSAVNHDGPSSGLTVPNGPAQQALLRQALSQAGVSPVDVDFVECHGTGTALGDPIEVQALSEVYGPGRSGDRPLVLGAAKANVAHLEAASGLASLLKAVLALRHEQIPAQPELGELNPHLPWNTLPVAVPRKAVPWGRGARPRRAGVSAFGLSGTNVHVVLEEAPEVEPVPAAPARPVELVVLSAKSAAALDAAAERLSAHLSAHPELSLGDVAFTLATTRSPMEHRLAIATTSREALRGALDAAAQRQTPQGAVRGKAVSSRGKLAFLFTGQGAQMPGMGRGLYEAWPAFREAFDRCAALFDRELDQPLREVMWAAPGLAQAARLDQTAYAQPALFALEYALAALWRSWGVEPHVLLGHSIGELVAACVASVFSLEDAVRLVAARGRLMQALPAGGAMVAIAASEAEVAASVAPHAATVSIAAVNGPDAVVIAGAEVQVLALGATFAARGIRTKRLAVSHAFHSPLMDPMLEDFQRVAATIAYRAPDRPVVSNVTGRVAGPEIATPEYWVRHVRSAVRFGDGAKALHAAGAATFVEIGPKPVLLGLLPACLGEADAVLVPSLRADRSECEVVLAALGAWYAWGGALDWKGVFPDGARRVALPMYPWQRERHWMDLTPRSAAPAGIAGRWPLAGVGLCMPGAVLHHVLSIGPRHQPFLGDHLVFGKVVVPGAFHVAVILSIAAERWPERAIELTGVEFLKAIAMEPDQEVELHAVLTPEAAGDGYLFELATLAAPETERRWTTHARGRVQPTDGAPGALPRLEVLEDRAIQPLDFAGFLDRLSAVRIGWGPLWRWLQDGRVGDEASLATLVPTYPNAHDVAPLHPILLDNGFAVSLLATRSEPEDDGTPPLPFAVERVRWWRAPVGRVRCGGVPRSQAFGVSSFVLVDETGEVVAEVEGFVCRRAPREVFLRQESGASTAALYRLDWPEAPLPDAPAERMEESWVVVAAPGSEMAAALATRLNRCVLAEPKGLEAALAGVSPAGVICLWEAGAHEEAPAAAQRVATEGLSVVQALRDRAVRLWWVTMGAVAVEAGERVQVATAPVWGLGRTVMQERPELCCTLVDLEPEADAARSADVLLRELGRADDETQVVFRSGKRRVARLVKATTPEGLLVPDAESYRLEAGQKGTLDQLRLAPAQRRAPGPGEVEIKVTASGLNFRTVLAVLGMYPGDAGPMGGDCAGVVTAVGQGVRHVAVGDAVMTLGTLHRFVTVDARLVVRQPAGLTPAQAATVPVAFLTAWLALHDLGNLRRGERVLIHAAAGGVGMAAVQIARWIGAEVFATASPSKWAAVQAMGVPRTHIASSRTLEFAETFRQVTGGRGVDVVLNALAGEFVDASLSLLSTGGRFLEMGKTDIRDRAAVAAAHPGVRYRVFDILELAPDRTREILERVVEGFAAGHLRALPVHAFAITKAEAAFRFMAQARHQGKVVLLPAPSAAPLAPTGTVLLTGGLGALGLHVARWLAQQGVPHMVLTGRRGLDTPGAAKTVAEIEALGARVTIAASDVADRNALEAVLQAIPAEWPLQGVIHAAGALDDGVLDEQTTDRFSRVLAPKVTGAWNLHELTSGNDLAFFVLFSSMSGLLGSAGQSNYAAANTFLDALAAHRRAEGLAAQSLAWGPWSDGGMAAGLSAALQARLARHGMGALSPAQGTALLGQALARPETQLGAMSLDVRAASQASGAAVPPVWRALVRAEARHAAAGAQGALAARLGALPEARRADEVRKVVQAEIARVLSWSAASAVPVDRPLSDLGLDSLTAVELRNVLGQRVGATLPATLAFDHPTVDALTRWLLDKVLAVAEPSVSSAKSSPQVALDEPIAIIGIGCRFPGGVADPESFWRLLEEGSDAVVEVPHERWDIDAFYDPDPDVRGKMTTRFGGFLSDIDRFEPAFFGISPREATTMDPQQRLLLETSWEAFERAGILPERLMGSDTGVFVGLFYQEYAALAGGIEAFDGYLGTGTTASVASGRISYVLGLKGPSLTVDTACSSSLVAVHLACQALRRGECSVALAGGVALMLTPATFVEFSRLRGLAPDGRCKSFSAAADGVGWSEGCAMLLLKPLRDAQRDGDPILAVIRGTAVNQDGRSNGLTAPNGSSQQEVIRRALEQAGLAPADVSYVECHGTGTTLGDPIEVQALGAVLAQGRPSDRPLVIGSVKSNIGHTQAAAGVAGVIKVALALERGLIPRSLHFDAPNPHIPWSELAVQVAAKPVEWTRNGAPRRAGVSSFGVSGTNAHVVLEEAPAAAFAPAAARSAELFVLSAKSAAALDAQAARLSAHVVAHPELGLGDLAFSLATTRSPMTYRLAVAATSREALSAALDTAAQGQAPPAAARGHASTGSAPKVVFVFPGQGSQWLGMGQKLLSEEPVFRDALSACDRAIQAEAGWSLLAELAADETTSQLGRIDVVQPALFAIEVALSALWRSWGVEPDAVVGHSMGEVAAAHVAGALSLEDAVAIICRRSLLLRRISGQGEMAVVELSLAEAEAALLGYEDRLSVAVSNSPRSTVLAGEPAALAEVLAILAAKGVFCRRVKVDVASHSPQIDPLRDELLAALGELEPRQATVSMRSTVTSTIVAGPELVASYWADNVRQPVRFAEAVQSLMEGGHGLFVEMSPHPILTTSVEEIRRATKREGVAVGSLRRGQDERLSMLEALGALWVHGQAVGWERLFSAGGAGLRRVPLPTYPWQRERYWVEAPTGGAASGSRFAHAGSHPLLGEMQTLSTQRSTRVWETTLDLKRLPWLGDHRVQGAVVFPGAAYLEMALSSGAEALGDGPLQVSDVVLAEALAFADDTPVAVQVMATEERPGRLQFLVASRVPGHGRAAFRSHARGVLRQTERAEVPARLDLAALRARLQASAPAAATYAALAEMGLEYGPAFQGLVELWRGEGEALGRVRLPEAAGSPAACRLHPALLDACFHVSSAFADRGEATPWVPVEIGSLRWFQRPSGELWCHARSVSHGKPTPDRRSTDFWVVDSTGAIVAEISGLVAQRLAGGVRRREEDDWFMEPAWEPTAVPGSEVTAGRWLLIGSGGGLGAALYSALTEAGHSVVHATGHGTSAAGLQALLTASFDGQAPTSVVHLGSLDERGVLDADAPFDADALEESLVRGCDSVLWTVQAVAGAGFRDPPRLWLVTRGAQAIGAGDVSVAQAPLLGLGRVIALEHAELRCARIDLDPARCDGEVDELLAELLADDAEEEVAFRGGERRVARLVRRLPETDCREKIEPAEGRPFRLEIDGSGVLDDLVLRATERRPPGPGEVEIAVEAAGLNFLDVMRAMGIYPGSGDGPVALGAECSGRIVAMGEGVESLHIGQDVVAVAPFSFGTHVTIDARMVAPRPAALTAAQAAALPVALMTAWYGLVHLGRLRAGERVLIHSATGGTGLAAVQIARHLGAEIFATAGTPEKRAWLREQGIAHVMDSRSLDFAEQVLVATKGEGVDVVLNSLSGAAIDASLATLVPDGRFIELGKTDIYADRSLGLAHFRKSLSYSAVDLAGLAVRRPERVAALLAEVVDLLARGALQPLPVEIFPLSRAADAFRKMAQAQHLGKLVLALEDPDVRIRVPGESGVAIRADGTYLVTGGLGGLGLSVAGWLAEQGAGHLVLVGRSGAVSAEQQTAVAALEAHGARVTVARADVADRAQIERILREVTASGMPLRGVVHAAGILDDGLLMQQTPARFRAVMAPKVRGALHLHALTREAPLSFFVLYASGAGLLGSPGQGNYAAANTFLDALAHHRRAQGLPALSIDWGLFADVGLAAGQQNRGARLVTRGTRSLTPDEGLWALERLLDGDRTQAGVMPFDVRQWVEFYPAAASSRRLSRLVTARRVASGRLAGDRDLLERLATAEAGARAGMLQEVVRAQVSQVLRLPEGKLDVDAPLTSLGMDSLMGLELRNRIEAVLGITMPATLLWTYPTVAALSAHLASHVVSTGDGESARPPDTGNVAPMTHEVASLDEDGLFALIDESLARAGKR